ncbi:glycosyltransferase [Pedobacter frigiditerrae]|uniref:Glycosyltransferase n=1 Tax=Pedobacter frigiditerrae TaxID=2530452 RepID=A0A4R0MZ98_9SPHI|nr:glycosyltransferase [Pedobacter frigiditerrae]TCC92263.1 glycosyltransferase [Pedobacter frigiditerrae]
MKIIHIIAAYKPAFIYGGPTMSVAKLCEALGEFRGLEVRGLGVREAEALSCGGVEGNENNVESSSRLGVEMAEVELLRRKGVEGNENNVESSSRLGVENGSSSGGGVEAFNDIDVEVLTTTANGKTELAVVAGERQLVDGVGVTYFRRLTKDHTHFSPALLRGLRREILRYKKNPPPTPSKGGHTLAIHIHAWWNLVSILSCWVAKWYQVPVVLSPRGMLTDYTLGNRNVGFKSIIHWLIGKRLLRYCHIHATSEKEKEDILKFIKPKSITVIANLVEGVGRSEYQEAKKQTTPQLSNSTTQPTSSFKLIFLSRIEEKKGLELLFDALAKFDADWSLTIAGSGEQGYVDGLAVRVEGLGISDRINWVGHVKNEDKFKLLAEHDLMVLTSYNENFANVVIESLSVGTAVLLSDQVGLANYVEVNKLGWITTLNTAIIANTIRQAYDDKEKRSGIRATATEIISRDYNTKNLISQYCDLYHSI